MIKIQETPSILRLREALVEQEKDIRSSYEKGDIQYDSVSGKVNANKACSECGQSMVFADPHFTPDAIAYVLSGNSFVLDGLIELFSLDFQCTSCGDHSESIE